MNPWPNGQLAGPSRNMNGLFSWWRSCCLSLGSPEGSVPQLLFQATCWFFFLFAFPPVDLKHKTGEPGLVSVLRTHIFASAIENDGQDTCSQYPKPIASFLMHLPCLAAGCLIIPGFSDSLHLVLVLGTEHCPPNPCFPYPRELINQMEKTEPR